MDNCPICSWCHAPSTPHYGPIPLYLAGYCSKCKPCKLCYIRCWRETQQKFQLPCPPFVSLSEHRVCLAHPINSPLPMYTNRKSRRSGIATAASERRKIRAIFIVLPTPKIGQLLFSASWENLFCNGNVLQELTISVFGYLCSTT